MKADLFIRADANPAIGLGHLIRCIALAHMLKDDFTITFYCHVIPEEIVHDLNESEFKLRIIGHENKFISCIKEGSLVVLDGYHFDSNYQSLIKSKGALLVCIDDLHDREFFADLIINPAPGVCANQYQAAVYGHFALGPDYILLRPSFLEQAKKNRVINKIETVLICFGGSDPVNLTESTLRVVTQFDALQRIVVVIGPMFKSESVINYLAACDSRITLFKSVGDEFMLQLLMSVQLAIVPSSGLLMEAIAAGNCIISGMYVSNQKFVYEAFRDEGLFVDAGNFSDEQLKKSLELVINNTPTPKKIIDGNSGKRLHKRFRQLSTTRDMFLRNARLDDLALVYNWANNQAIRTFSFSNADITWEEHVNWFHQKLNDQRCVYYIAEFKQEIIGSVRYDIENEDAVISYLIDPRFHSYGYGLPLLARSFGSLICDLMVRSIKVTNLVGYVMTNNLPSIKTFVNLGFDRYTHETRLKFVKTLK